MKTILCGAVAAIALVGIAAPAAAQTHERDYAGTQFGGWTATNPSNDHIHIGPFTLPSEQDVLDAGVALGIGTRYTADANAPGDSEQAQHRINVAFHLRGTVNRDCSFYSGNSAAARNIDFGVIGVRTGDNENVNSAFEMVGPADANIETLTAGCNTNNVVEINKDDIRGLVNNNPGGYDTNEFQANIPYQVKASWTGVALNAQTTGTPQSLTVGTNANAGTRQQGAWRSNMQIDIHAPAVTSHGLVAGTYTGKTTITLRAI